MKSHRILFRRAAVAVCLLFLGSGTALAADKTIRFGDLSWDSAQVHNRIAGFILKHGYGYEPEYIPGETIPIVTGLMRGDVDVDMESWTENIQEVYDKGIASGDLIDLGPNYSDSWQGWLVPTYMIEGDSERGIEATAPDLKSVSDMAKYWELFKDPESPSKGRFHNSIPGWSITDANSRRLKAYGLDKYYTDFMPGSDAALAGSLAAAYRRGEPWFGYYWSPTWVLGLYDMTQLEEPAYDPEIWESTKACAIPPNRVNILVNRKLPERAPDAVAFLRKYETTAELNNRFLAEMRSEKLDTRQVAEWFLKNHEDIWTGWVDAEVADKVKAALE